MKVEFDSDELRVVMLGLDVLSDLDLDYADDDSVKQARRSLYESMRREGWLYCQPGFTQI